VRLLEFQAKRLFAQVGIPVPRGELLTSPGALVSIRYPAVLKAQVLAGGRGKAGGVAIARTLSEGLEAGRHLFADKISGMPVRALLCEEFVAAISERYISLVIDRTECEVVFIASARGGSDVEELSRKGSSLLVRKRIDLCGEAPSYVVRAIARTMGLADPGDARVIVQGMLALLQAYDATLVEINPLACTAGSPVALDAKMVLDSKARFRHASLFEELLSEQRRIIGNPESASEHLAAQKELLYVPLEGSIGVISDGAGTGMLMLDMIGDAGGRPECFCEMGGHSDAKTMRDAMEVVLANARVRVLLVGLIGGLTRMDEMARGIVDFLGGSPCPTPIVVRMCGTKEEQGRATLLEAGIDASDDLHAAVRQAVRVATD